jgi:hypothetical protein
MIFDEKVASISHRRQRIPSSAIGVCETFQLLCVMFGFAEDEFIKRSAAQEVGVLALSRISGGYLGLGRTFF